MIQSEIGGLQIQSDALLQQVNYLTQPVVKLSSAERRLFKKPVFDVQDPNTLVAIKNDAPIGAEPHPGETAPAKSNTGESAATPAPSAEPANSTPPSEGAAPAPDAGAPRTGTKPIETTKLENPRAGVKPKPVDDLPTKDRA